MAFFLPLLGGLAKVAGGQAMGQVARQAAVGAGKNFVKNRIGGRGRGGGGRGGQGGGGGGGSIIRTTRGAVAQTPMVGGFIMQSPETPKKVNIKKVTKVSFDSVGGQLTSIESVCKSIEQITGQTIKDKQKRALNARKSQEKAKKAEREAKSEGGGNLLAGIGGAARQVGQRTGFFNFLTQMLMGMMALGITSILPQVMSAISFIGKNLHLMFLGIKGIGMAVKAMKPFIMKGLNLAQTAFQTAVRPFGRAAKALSQGISKSFKKLSTLIPKFITSSINYAKAAVKYGSNVLSNTSQAARSLGRPAPSKALGASATKLNRLIRGSATSAATTSSQAVQGALLLRKNHGDEAARMYKGLVDNGMNPTKAANYVKKQLSLGKITSTPMKGSLGAGIKGSNVLKGGIGRSVKRGLIAGLGKGGLRTLTAGLRRIPIIGPLIVGVVSLLSGEPAAQALFKAGGAALGGFLGTFIPIPIIGTLLGELIGEYVGDLMYTATMGGGVEALGSKLQSDITNMLKAGSAALGWLGDGLGRLYEGIPKFKIPDGVPGWLLGPIEGLMNLGGKSLKDFEIPNPFWFINPLNVFEKVALAYKAFFTRDSMNPESTAKAKAGEQPQEQFNENNTTSSPPNTSTDPNAPIQEGFRPGSDALADKVKIAPGSTASKTEYNSTGGNNKRRIFLHWSAGSYTNPYDAYHTIFMGDGKAVRHTPYGVDKHSHTGGGNTGSIGLSMAAMAGGTENAKSWPTPPKQTQIDAMTSEAAQIAVDWGYSNTDVDRLVMTHGEWERYATRNGILPGRPDRWDLDKLKPSDPRIDTSKVKSHGGNTLRAMIKAKMNAIKNGDSTTPEEQKPSAQSTQAEAKQTVTVQPTTPMAGSPVTQSPDTPVSEDDPRSANPDADVKAEKKAEDNTRLGSPSTDASNQTLSASAKRIQAMRQAAFNEVMGITNTGGTRTENPDADLHGGLRGSNKGTPAISAATSPSAKAMSVEAQASYEQFLGLSGGDAGLTLVPVPAGGGSSPPPAMSKQPPSGGSGDSLNSYQRAQIIGHLYKFG